MLGVLAGFLIGIGAIVYLTVGSVPGAVLFAVGLMGILNGQLHLFTGKAGLLAIQDGIKPKELALIWLQNFKGVLCAVLLVLLTPLHSNLYPKAMEIVALRNSNGPITNILLGIGCGVLMWVAVSLYKDNPLCIVWPVAVFILCGFNHCVADMFYTLLGAVKITDLLSLIPTTIGNIIGCCLIPAGYRYYYEVQHKK